MQKINENLFPTVTQAARDFWMEIKPDYSTHITRGFLDCGDYGLSAFLTTTNGANKRVLLRIPIMPKRQISQNEFMVLSELISNNLCQITASDGKILLHSKSALPETELYSPIETVFSDAKVAMNILAKYNIL
ncbi:MAG: hypothetical protein JEZ07_15040 [Phycisphaerae bacterium]|nr:hypothetical protein [Phycisphaerae bacterium]